MMAPPLFVEVNLNRPPPLPSRFEAPLLTIINDRSLMLGRTTQIVSSNEQVLEQFTEHTPDWGS